MKKRLLSLLLVMTIVLSVLVPGTAMAEENSSQAAQQSYSTWAFEDLVVGDTYGIYPQSWYLSGMQKPITNGQIRVLMSGLRSKILNTDCVIGYDDDVKYNIQNNMTVKDVLEVLYTLISSYEFDGDIGMVAGESAVDYMAKSGVFTGKEGGLTLKDICTVEQACVIATRLVTYLYDVLDAASKGFLWEINSGENTVYLLGSIHIANYDIYPFSNKLLKAFAESDVLGVELDLLGSSNDGNMLLVQYGTYTDGTTLKDHVSEDTYEKTIKVASIYGYSEEIISMFKPWAIFIMFSAYANTATGSIEEASTAVSLGIDMKFIIDAYLMGKPIVELEGYELQLSVLNSFSDELAEYLLLITMDALIDIMEGNEDVAGNEAIETALDYWHRGDVEGFMEELAPSLRESEFPNIDELNDEEKEILVLIEEYYQKLFLERDIAMAEKIDEFLQGEGSTTYFVVVGSGHYISDYSVLDMLIEKGYEINQIK